MTKNFPRWNFHLIKDNDRETGLYCWEKILDFFPKDKIIWQPFYCTGLCKTQVEGLGYKVEHEKKDFFEWEPDNWDLIIDNPPYNGFERYLNHLEELNKPFCVLIPMAKLKTLYILKFINKYEDKISIIFLNPNKANFIKNGVDIGRSSGKGSFNPISPMWLCYDVKQYVPKVFNYNN